MSRRGTRAPVAGHIGVEPSSYVPPDPTRIETGDPRALDYWARTLEVAPEAVRDAARKAGPLLEDVKRELGIGGIG
jgi:hypothetical protein